jgi:hypothetical protein
MGQREFLKERRQAPIERAVPLSTGLLALSLADPR